MKRSLLILLVISAFFSSCAEQKPKHLIHGKWLSEGDINTELVFSEDNKCKLKTFGENEKVFNSQAYDFETIDDASVKINFTGYGPYQLKVIGKIESNKTLLIQCFYSKDAKGRTPVDLPEICNKKFKTTDNGQRTMDNKKNH